MMLGYPYPTRPQHLLLLFLQAQLCLLSSLGAAGLSFSYDFSIPDPGGIHYKDFTYLGDSSDCTTAQCVAFGSGNRTGRFVYSQPVRMWDGRTGKRASFNTSFSFAMLVPAAKLNGTRPQGPGMAFFVGPYPAGKPPPGSGGWLMGLFTNPSYNARTVGVEFDTHWDSDYDPDDVASGDHVGIDVDWMRSESYTRDLARGDLSAGTLSADIVYDAGSNLMVVTVRLANGSSTSISALVDLKRAGVPRDAAVGFSAATGMDAYFSPRVISWSFSSTDPSIPLWVIIVTSVASAILATSLVAAILFVIMRKRWAATTVKIELTVAKKFSYKELSASTNNFSEDRKLGAGSFGKVYRGTLQDPRLPQVAVKVLTRPMEDPQTRKDYVNEVTTLGRLSHQNLVKLVGWCTAKGNGSLLLVYELVSNRSLDEHLHGLERLLAWPERYQAVLDVGLAIEYLHTGSKEPILHRDIKPANVMLDDAFRAKLGDFGLVRQVDPGQGSLGGTTMIGSRDYIDPACVTAETVCTASDMYSFGVLLLEIAAGKRPHASLDPEAGFPNTLTDAVREAYRKGAVLDMADARLDGDFDESEMRRVLLVGLLCVQLERKSRPEIREAIYWLKNPSHPLPQIGVV